MKNQYSPSLIMGIALTTRGLGYALLEGPETPFDWGLMRRENMAFEERTVERIHKIIRAYHPQVLVIEKLSDGKTRHSAMLRQVSRQILHRAASEAVIVVHFDRRDVRHTFAPLGAKSKADIASAVTIALPALNHRLPPIRKLWMSEDARQLIFDAAALVLTYYKGKQLNI